MKTYHVEVTETAAERKKTRFSKKIIIFCLIATSILLLSDIALCWRALEQLDPSSVAAFCTLYGVEFLSLASIKKKEIVAERGQPEPGANGPGS